MTAAELPGANAPGFAQNTRGEWLRPSKEPATWGSFNIMVTFRLPKFTLSIVRKVILVVVVLVGIFGAGYYLGLRNFQVSTANNYPTVTISRELPGTKKNLEFTLFWKVWDLLEATYFDKTKIIPANLVYGAIQGMVAAVGDPYTAYFPPSQNKIVREDLNGGLEGIGIQIGFRGTQLAVIAPLPATPAERAGIKAGDFIVGIKDERKKVDHGTAGISIEQAVSEIRGPAGTAVTLVLLRDGTDEPITLDITREKIDVPSVILEWQENIAHIKLLKFAQETDGEWDKVVNDVNAKCQNIDDKCKVVLDVRNNPGGYLQGAVDIAGDFLPQGTLVVIEERGDGTRQEYKTDRTPRLADYPLVVLINKGSASASEILAGALRDQRKIQIVGETSFGKGTIQEPDELPDGSGLHVTIAKWLTPNSVWVHSKGLEPDVKVEINDTDTEDMTLKKAIEELK